MSVNYVNGNVGAYYPKYLEDKKKRAMALAYSGAATTISGCACHFVKNSLAVKHPKILLALTMLGFVGSLLGLSAAGKAQKELNEINQQKYIMNAKV